MESNSILYNFENIDKVMLSFRTCFSLPEELYDDWIVIPRDEFVDGYVRILLSSSSKLRVWNVDNDELEFEKFSSHVNVFCVGFFGSVSSDSMILYPEDHGMIGCRSLKDFKLTRKYDIFSVHSLNNSVYQIKVLDDHHLVVGGCDRNYLNYRTDSCEEMTISRMYNGFFICVIDLRTGTCNYLRSHKTAPWTIEKLEKNSDCFVSAGGGEREDQGDHYIRKWNWRVGKVQKEFAKNIHFDRIVCMDTYISRHEEFIVSGSRDDIFARWDVDGKLLNKFSSRTMGGGIGIERSNGGVYSIRHYRDHLFVVGTGSGTLNILDIENPPILNDKKVCPFSSQSDNVVCSDSKVYVIRWFDDRTKKSILTNFEKGLGRFEVLDSQVLFEPDVVDRMEFLKNCDFCVRGDEGWGNKCVKIRMLGRIQSLLVPYFLR